MMSLVRSDRPARRVLRIQIRGHAACSGRCQVDRPPHSASVSRSEETTSPAFTSSTAKSLRCLGPRAIAGPGHHLGRLLDYPLISVYYQRGAAAWLGCGNAMLCTVARRICIADHAQWQGARAAHGRGRIEIFEDTSPAGDGSRVVRRDPRNPDHLLARLDRGTDRLGPRSAQRHCGMDRGSGVAGSCRCDGPCRAPPLEAADRCFGQIAHIWQPLQGSLGQPGRLLVRPFLEGLT